MLVLLGEYGAERNRNALERHSNAGMVIRGTDSALEQFLLKTKENAEILDIQIVFVRRSGNWLTVVDGHPKDVLGKD